MNGPPPPGPRRGGPPPRGGPRGRPRGGPRGRGGPPRGMPPRQNSAAGPDGGIQVCLLPSKWCQRHLTYLSYFLIFLVM